MRQNCCLTIYNSWLAICITIISIYSWALWFNTKNAWNKLSKSPTVQTSTSCRTSSRGDTRHETSHCIKFAFWCFTSAQPMTQFIRSKLGEHAKEIICICHWLNIWVRLQVDPNKKIKGYANKKIWLSRVIKKQNINKETTFGSGRYSQLQQMWLYLVSYQELWTLWKHPCCPSAS